LVTIRPTSHAGLVLAFLPVLSACRSADSYRRSADREVYEIIRERREALAAGEPFTIEPPAESLRARLLAGEVLAHPLTLVDSLNVAAENSREYRERRESLYLAALDLTLERWRFSTIPSGTIEAFAEGEGRTGTSHGVLSDFGVTKLLGTGLVAMGNVGFDLTNDLVQGDGWKALSDLSLTVTQPLLRGFGEEVVREPLTQSERSVLYEARAYERFRRTFAFDVASRFFRILEQQDTLVNEERNFEGLVTLRERNEAFAEAGLLNDIEVDQARQDELRARNRVIEARRNLETALDDFKFFLGLPIEAELAVDAAGLLELSAWPELELDFPETEVVEVALSRRLDHLTTVDVVADAKRRVRVAADALRPGLDLVVMGDAMSDRGSPLDYESPDEDWRVSLELDLALDRLLERNAYRAALISFEGARRTAEASADLIRSDLRESIRRLAAARETYEIQTGAVALAERRVESAQLNLEAGRASTRDVLEAQEDLLGARNAASSALTEYVLSGLGLYRDMELVRVTDEGIDVETAPLLEATGGSSP
jgi:outer membrane protein TolC